MAGGLSAAPPAPPRVLAGCANALFSPKTSPDEAWWAWGYFPGGGGGGCWVYAAHVHPPLQLPVSVGG